MWGGDMGLMSAKQFDWNEKSKVKVVMPGKTLVELRCNRAGLKDLIAQLQYLLEHEGSVHYETVEDYGPLEEGSLELSVWVTDDLS